MMEEAKTVHESLTYVRKVMNQGEPLEQMLAAAVWWMYDDIWDELNDLRKVMDKLAKEKGKTKKKTLDTFDEINLRGAALDRAMAIAGSSSGGITGPDQVLGIADKLHSWALNGTMPDADGVKGTDVDDSEDDGKVTRIEDQKYI